MPLTRDVLTPQQVAEYLRVAPETVYRYIRQGELIASKLGRQYRNPKENPEPLLLITSTAGNTPLRTFSDTQLEEWLEEDEIDRETHRKSERLQTTLRKL